MSRRAAFVLACGLAVLAFHAAEQPADAPATPAFLGSLVNPFIGTQDYGNTFPGAALPFGMVQLSPDDGGQAGYDHDNVRIDGFSHTHLSGVGCNALGEIRVMPTTGAVTSDQPSSFGSHYSHDTEVARPGYYAVDLTRYRVRAELTATARTGWHRYTFPATSRSNVLFDLRHAVMPVLDAQVHVTGDRTLEGYQDVGGFCTRGDRHRVYFSARFDRPFAHWGLWKGGRFLWTSFDTSANRAVNLQVGLSYTSVAGARRNLGAEADGQDFDDVARSAEDRWEDMLGRARVEGGPAPRRVAFTTALYHALLHPNLVADVDGSYTGADGRVHVATDHAQMGNLSLWDTFRTQNQLLELVAPDVARNVALSVLADGRDGGGWLPRWSLVTSETNIMTGDPVTPFLVENWSTGLLAGHEQEAYALLRRNAFGTPPASVRVNGRTGNPTYTRRGYIPTGQPCPRKSGSTDCGNPASATLEYAAADGALATMARALGHGADARALTRRAQNYRNLFDRRVGFFRPRDGRGRWMKPYDPHSGGYQFHEGGAYQYTWLVPQDAGGLVGLLGGRRATERRLDAFFDYRGLLRGPAATAHRSWVDNAYDYYRASTYNPNNEPDLHAPYMYAWAGAPSKINTVLRGAWTLFTTGPEGMTGNDDLGTMSAWYVLTSLGLYPVMSGSRYFVLSTPQFPKATVRIPPVGSSQGGTLTVEAPGAGDAARYTASASIDGRPIRRSWLTRGSVAHGGTLRYSVSRRPTNWATGPGAAPPSRLQAPLGD